MTSQGQRFRRRALRRGYKVEEVDRFLDRVEATLNGERADPPVRAKEVHDVVFRVKFGGYDEWQVDLHLDRVERQLAELEPDHGQGGGPERMPMGERPGAPIDRPFERPPVPGGPMAGQGMQGPGMHGPGMQGPGMPVAGMPAPGMSPLPSRPAGPPGGYPRYDDPTERGEPGSFPPPPGYRPGTPYGAQQPGGGHTYGGPAPGAPMYGGGPEQRPGQGGYGPNERGVHADRTTQMPLQPPPGGRPAGPGPGPRDTGGLPPRDTSGFGGPGMTAPPRPAAPGGYGRPDAPPTEGFGQPAPAGPPMSPDMQRVDQLRRTFQPRRFGSGYDRAEVDDLFEGILATLSGRTPRPVGDADLDPQRFNLVAGGYYEDEVDDALRQARDILRRQ